MTTVPSLRRLLVLSVSLTLVLCVAGVLMLANVLQSREVERQSAQRMATVAKNAEHRVLISLQERFYELRTVGETIGRGERFSIQGLQPVFDQMLREYEGYAWIGLTDRQGRVLVASHGHLLGRSMAQRPWFQRSLSGPYIGSVHRAEMLAPLLPPDEDGLPPRLLDIAIPIGPEGKREAVLSGRLNWFWLDGLLQEYELESSQGVHRQVLLLDEKGMVLRGPKNLVGSPLPDRPPGTGDAPSHWATADWLNLAQAIPDDPKLGSPRWTLVVRESREDLVHISHQMRSALIVAALPLLALFLAAIWLLGRYIARPLEQISQAAGKGEDIPNVAGYREARELQENLRRMTQELKAQHAQVEAEVEARMAEMNQLLKALNMHTLVTMADSKGNITYVNDLFCQVSGYSREEVLGQNHRVVKSDVHSPEFYQDMWATLTAGKIWSGVVCNQKKNGELYWVKSVIAPADPGNPSPHAFVSVRTDITELMEAQQTLQRLSNDLLRRSALTTLLNDITATANEAFDRRDAIRRCLAKVCDFMHWQVAHAYVIDPQNPSVLRSSKQWYLSNARRFQAFREQTEALCYRRGTGLPGRVLELRRPVFVTTSEPHETAHLPRYRAGVEAGLSAALGIPITAGDEILGVVECFGVGIPQVDNELMETFRNIGVQIGFAFKRHEDAITLQQAMDAAQKANRAKTEFLSSMSHELRTPLNAILGFAQILANSTRHPLNEKQAGQVQHILRSGEYLLHLINEVLDLSRIESGRLSLSIEKTSLRAIMEDCIAKVLPLAEQAGITVETQCTIDGGDALVRVDRVRLQQVMFNLLSNAIKYNRPQGSVRVRGETDGPGHVKVTIADTGYGIPPERQAEMFQPFNRLGAENSEIQGTGIGLTITRQLIHAMHGDIGFTSCAAGTEFWVRIPIAGADTETLARELPTEVDTVPLRHEGTLRVLCVEDNPSNIQLMHSIFDNLAGYELRMARSCDEAFGLIRAGKPDIILMDINLPGISGIEGTAILKADESTRDIPIIALSADAMEETRQKALAAGVVEYLTKPVKVNLLLASLERVAHGQDA
ncbi:hypothetical protein DLREEDagrD3_06170 [Denitratisoma sp. agr-D3]